MPQDEQLDDYSPDLITLTDEDGKEFSFEVIDAADYNDERYLAVVPYAEDSTEQLEEDAESIRQTIARNFGDFSPSDFKQSGDSLQDRVSDIVRRAKALAGVEQ